MRTQADWLAMQELKKWATEPSREHRMAMVIYDNAVSGFRCELQLFDLSEPGWSPAVECVGKDLPALVCGAIQAYQQRTKNES